MISSNWKKIRFSKTVGFHWLDIKWGLWFNETKGWGNIERGIPLTHMLRWQREISRKLKAQNLLPVGKQRGTSLTDASKGEEPAPLLSRPPVLAGISFWKMHWRFYPTEGKMLSWGMSVCHDGDRILKYLTKIFYCKIFVNPKHFLLAIWQFPWLFLCK